MRKFTASRPRCDGLWGWMAPLRRVGAKPLQEAKAWMISQCPSHIISNHRFQENHALGHSEELSHSSPAPSSELL